MVGARGVCNATNKEGRNVGSGVVTRKMKHRHVTGLLKHGSSQRDAESTEQCLLGHVRECVCWRIEEGMSSTFCRICSPPAPVHHRILQHSVIIITKHSILFVSQSAKTFATQYIYNILHRQVEAVPASIAIQFWDSACQVRLLGGQSYLLQRARVVG
jgi:hypothetical protein